jgi:NAD(P)-dependent dehydrogenase (short-subunit alcohol dehydrogenase family)
MALFTGKDGMVSAVTGVLIVVTVVAMRNQFLMTNFMEMVHRAKHALSGGDRYERIKAVAEFDPWFGKTAGVAIVTGSNSGIGFETARSLARTGCRVVLAVRSQERGEAAAARILADNSSARVDVMLLDMTSVASVRAFAAAFLARKLPLHVLVHNAGATSKDVSINADGLENTMALNYLSVVLLSSLLLPVLRQTAPSRIIFVGSSAHFVGVKSVSLCFADRKDKPINGWDLYGSSKLNVVAYANALARQLSSAAGKEKVSVCSVDPGFTATGFYNPNAPFPISLFGKMAGMVAKNPETGSHSSLFAALSPVPPPSGAYLADTVVSSASATARDEEFQKQLMDATVKKIKEAASWWDEHWF